MQLFITNGQLMSIEMDFQNILRQPGLGLLLGPKIKRFNEQNKYRSETLRNEANKLLDKYVMKDDKGVPIIIADKGGARYRYLSEEAERSYNNEMNELLSKGFNIEV